MKKSHTNKFLVILTIGILTFGGYIWGYRNSPSTDHDNSIKSSTHDRPRITDDYPYTMMDDMGANPESTLQIRQRYQDQPYTIQEGPGNNTVIVYFPRFSVLSEIEFSHFSEKLQALKQYNLEIDIFNYSPYEIASIQSLYKNLGTNFSSITWRFYDIPSNYYEFFRQFSHPLSEKDITIELYGKMIPDGFMISALIDNIRDMLHKNLPSGTLLNSITLSNEEMGDMFFMLPMSQSGTMTIQQLPTKLLFTKRILIDTARGGPGETLSGADKLYQFFHDSTIEHMQLRGVGEKVEGNITLY